MVTDPRTLAEEAKARAEKATPGPWETKGPSTGLGRYDDGGDYAVLTGGLIIAEAFRLVGHGTERPAFENAAFIAHARSDVPALADAVLRLVEENERLRRTIHEAIDNPDAGGPLRLVANILFAALTETPEREG